MFASMIEIQIKSGKMAEAIKRFEDSESEIKQLGCNQAMLIDKGNDQAIVLAIYDTEEAQQAATPLATKILSGLALLYAKMPERVGVNLPINWTFND